MRDFEMHEFTIGGHKLTATLCFLVVGESQAWLREYAHKLVQAFSIGEWGSTSTDAAWNLQLRCESPIEPWLVALTDSLLSIDVSVETDKVSLACRGTVVDVTNYAFTTGAYTSVHIAVQDSTVRVYDHMDLRDAFARARGKTETP